MALYIKTRAVRGGATPRQCFTWEYLSLKLIYLITYLHSSIHHQLSMFIIKVTFNVKIESREHGDVMTK